MSLNVAKKTHLERAGQRAQEVERGAARDIEQFMSEQMAEAEATEGFASTAEVAAGAAEAATAAEAAAGLSALALFGEAALGTAAGMGAAAGGLAVAGGAAALVGTAWALHLLGLGGGGGATDTDASRPSSAPDIQTLNGTQEFAWTPTASRSRGPSQPQAQWHPECRPAPRGPRASRQASTPLPGAVLGQ